jgi:hypothetical protein
MRLLRTMTTAAAATSAGLALAAAGGARLAAAPVNTADPTIAGPSVIGQTLTASRGTWTGTQPITYAYAWQRCDGTGANCSPISGATNQTYKPISADLGKMLRVYVTASNSSGDVVAKSDPTAQIANASGKPASNAPPKVTGDAVVGSSLTTTTGDWSGDQPITYSYQWQRCDTNGNACADEGANSTSASYTVVKNDNGKTIRVEVTAKNSRGSTQAISTATDVVKASGSSGDIVDIGGGRQSAPVESVVAGQRLIIKSVSFTPNPVSSRNQTITARVVVTDTRGYYVRGAYVQIRSTPILTEAVDDQPTATDGTVTFHLQPQSNFPLKSGYNVQFFVKAYQKGQDPLAGVSTSRLVQVATKG